MFDYEQLNSDQIQKLEDSETEVLATAGLMIIHGLRNAILTEEEAARQLKNILIAIVVNS